MPRKNILSDSDIEQVREELSRTTVRALAEKHGVSQSTMGNYLRRHGVLNSFDGWRPERYDRLLGMTGRLDEAAIAEALECDVAELAVRREVLAEAMASSGLTFAQVAIVTGVDRTYWSQYLEEGWVTAQKAGRSRRLPLAELRKIAIQRPELFDFSAIPPAVRTMAQLDDLPVAPLFKLITCCSQSIAYRKITVDAVEDEQPISFVVKSCAELRGVDFWVPTYAIPTCPRCGVRASRFSEKSVYADQFDNIENVQDAMAQKIGLRWKNGSFTDPQGVPLARDDVDHYVTRISGGKGRERERRRQLINDIERYAPPRAY